MSWIIDDGGPARFTDQPNRWRVAVEPARPEAGLHIGRGEDAAPGDADGGVSIRLLPPEGHHFPRLVEAYARGNDLVAHLPQAAETHFGLNLSYRIIRSSADVIVCETVAAVQTDLLDSHPTLDLVCDSPVRPIAVSIAGDVAGDDRAVDAERAASTSPPAATWLDDPADGGATVLMLPPSDRAVAEDRSGPEASAICYRLLAEFLEKGVIRKTRYWVCRWAQRPSESEIGELYRELLRMPLPLTP